MLVLGLLVLVGCSKPICSYGSQSTHCIRQQVKAEKAQLELEYETAKKEIRLTTFQTYNNVLSGLAWWVVLGVLLGAILAFRLGYRILETRFASEDTIYTTGETLKLQALYVSEQDLKTLTIGLARDTSFTSFSEQPDPTRKQLETPPTMSATLETPEKKTLEGLNTQDKRVLEAFR